ncbi:glycosyltransferase family A protein [Oscillatoria sp. FACHB-1406]|uniref:glycosyltransferase family 2 protein n=1 Tax=Oscillatoria sp. FACHB-1406 TaxID=2692846 RepID=UPI0016843FE4|nr:glycosyltransferase family A protein [Oscillatoria sp. FACHB-1406]MBD2578881.1 glycosyltransferase family 2 protein [Oscillatoria sp. FACHB-1406]
MTLPAAISVIIPVYNCERYLAEAIESVLAQKYQPLEIIIVDDGSRDRTAEVAKSFGDSVQYHYQTQSGAATARNFGISLAKADYFAFLDADDRWVKDKLSRQMAVFESEPNLEMVLGYVQNFHSPELDETITRKIYCPPDPMPGYLPGTMLIKREAFQKVGLFETHLKVGEFISWYGKAKDLKIQEKLLSDVLLWRRIHETNTGIRERQSRSDYVRLVKATLDRRRSANQQSIKQN